MRNNAFYGRFDVRLVTICPYCYLSTVTLNGLANHQ